MSNALPTRQALGDTLVELAASNERIVALDADLAKSTSLIKFARNYPERFFECGIAEQNMMNVAAGLAVSGLIPFTGSFAIFATGRAFEQVRNSIAYPDLPVKLCPTHAGITVGEDGASHQAIEDLALMASIPNMKVIIPADYYEAKGAIKFAAQTPGPVYIRLGRPAVPVLFDDDYEFEYGKIRQLKNGQDVAIFACGIMTSKALEAAELLTDSGISAAVYNVPTMKTLDTNDILEAVALTGAAVTCEEHTLFGGLGSVITGITAASGKVPVVRVGIRDKFGESGKPEELLEKHGLTPAGIASAALTAIGLK